MTVTTNVPKPAFTDTGFVAPSEQAVLTGVQTDIDQAFGGGVNPALNTAQGQLASSTTAMIGNFDDVFIEYVNLINPSTSRGRIQDGIARIYFLERNPALPTVVQAQCLGGQDVEIPQGALARAADGNVYTCTTGGIIPASGTITLPFACNVNGPIACPEGSLNSIFRAIPGWDAVNNTDDGVLGTLEESPQEFERRRAASVGLNSRGSLPSILGAVLSVADVLDAFVTENVEVTPVTVRGVTLAAKSLYVAVVGGDLDAIATAIWSKKAPGCGYNGNTTRTVYDTSPQYTPPLPSYAVTFEVPAALPILFAVMMANNSQVPADATTQIQAAIIAAFAGADGGPRARIGSTVFASRFYAAVSALGAWSQIISIEVGSGNTPSSDFDCNIAAGAMSVSLVHSGTIAIGQTIVDAPGFAVPILPGTKIVSGSGTSWIVEPSQTLITSVRALGVLANQNSASCNIDQIPTINAANIAVTFS